MVFDSASGAGLVLDGHLIGRLRASAYCAPNQSFGLFRCSAWLILHKRSTGALIPKRSCSRASPLRRRTEPAVPAFPVFRSAYSPKIVHWTVFGETLDLQGLAPPCEPSKGSQGMRSVIACVSFLTVRAFAGWKIPLQRLAFLRDLAPDQADGLGKVVFIVGEGEQAGFGADT